MAKAKAGSLTMDHGKSIFIFGGKEEMHENMLFFFRCSKTLGFKPLQTTFDD